MMKYLVAGAKGQLGQEIVKLLEELGQEYVAFDSKQLDITNQEQVFRILESEMPNVVLDAAAYTSVDSAEDEGKQLNWRVNVDGTKNLADASCKIHAKLVYISTDYVFSGNEYKEYTEKDLVNPINEYGRAKLAGERAVQNSGVEYYIIRTSWVFGEFGKNFVYTMQNLASKLDKISVVNDQHGRPTWTRTLAEFMIYLISNDIDYGIYNLSNDETTTWYEFAKKILERKSVSIEPVTTDMFPTTAQRPKNSALSLDKTRNTGFKPITWKEALSRLMNNM